MNEEIQTMNNMTLYYLTCKKKGYRMEGFELIFGYIF